MPQRPAPNVQPPGGIAITSADGVVEVLPGYQGPRKAKDLPFRLPPRIWKPGRPRAVRAKAPAAPALVQVDGRSYTVDQKWSGLRFIFKVDRLAVGSGETTFNLFATHIGRTVSGVAHWTEVGIIRAVQDTRYRLYTYDSEVPEDDRWNFFGTMAEGEVFEFAIRLNEKDAGPYRFETFCSGKRVRKGSLPRLDCQVDLSHESWSETGTFSDGDHVIAVEGWVNYPPNKARWYATDLDVESYTTNGAVKSVNLGKPAALKFESST
jgi:hypothetical protein